MAASMGFEAHGPVAKLMTPKVRKQKAYEASHAGKARRARQHHLASQKRLAKSIELPSLFKSLRSIPIVHCQRHPMGYLEADPRRLRMRLTSYAVIQPSDLPYSRPLGQFLIREFHVMLLCQ